MRNFAFRSGSTRRAAIVGIDFAMVALSLVLALALRLDVDDLLAQRDLVIQAYLVYLPIAAVLLVAMRLDRIPWRFASLSDAVRLAEFAGLLNLLFLAALFLATRLDDFPRSTIIINALLVALFLAGARMAFRLFHEGRLSSMFESRPPGGADAERVLLIGAGSEAEAYLRALRLDPAASHRPIGALTRFPASVGTRLHGVPVRGLIGDLEAVVGRLGLGDLAPDLLVIADESLDGATVRSLLRRSQALGIPLKRLPRRTALIEAGGRLEVQPLELEDLLARPEIRLDRGLAEASLKDRVIAVTGAGGSIGSELCRQIAELRPRRLVLIDSSEHNLYEIDNALADAAPEVARAAHLADIRDRSRIAELFAAERPAVVYHAAALKHVPMLEAHPDEAVRTNVLGTRNVVDAALAAGATTFVMVSTDKATSPVSVMGATKRIAEAYCQAIDLERAGKAGTHMVTVRFGNVLGSRGSVVPRFREQIARGGPITITDQAATRFFMTISEASQLVIQASVMPELVESAGTIVVLDMGEPVKIVDLARNLVRLSGLEPERDIAFEYIGLRPGERLNEELFTAEEALVPTSHRDLRIASPSAADRALIERYIGNLERAATASDGDATRRLLERFLHAPGAPGGSQAAEV